MFSALNIARFGGLTILISFLIGCLAAFSSMAQDLLGFQIPPRVAVSPKLESVLQELLEKYQQDPAMARAFAAQRGILLKNDEIRVILRPVEHKVQNLSIPALSHYNAVIEAQSRSLLRVRIPLRMLLKIAKEIEGIQSIHLPNRPAIAEVTSEGVSLTGADTYQANGLNGQGVKVAVIDLGFEGLSAAITAGEFGNPSVIDPSCTMDFTGSGLETTTNHGTAVAEIVHDMAPKATLCLMKIGDEVDFENAVDAVIAARVHIVNQSLSWFNQGFYDGTGLVPEIAATARDKGIFWVNAAGNYALRHWEGAFSDTDSDNFLEFAASDECNSLGTVSAGEKIRILMTWDAWPADPQDYDLFLLDSTLNIVASSTNDQRSGTLFPPIEEINFIAPQTDTYCFIVFKLDAPASPPLEIFVPTHDLERSTPESSLAEPANNPKVFAVAAIDRANWAIGPQQPFSSQGPTNNSKFATSFIKPDLAGPDNVSSFTLGSFIGTSAAAPHVAGCAALIKFQNPGFTVDQIQEKLVGDAIDLGTSGKDNLFGWGKLNCIFSSTLGKAVKIGIFRPSNRLWYLDLSGNGKWDGNPPDLLRGPFGISEDLPVVGDWNGDGRAKIGVFRPSARTFYLDYNGNGAWDGPSIDKVCGPFGISTDLPVVGDWNGDGRAKIGVFRPSARTFYLDYNGNGTWDGTPPDKALGRFGASTDRPIVGDWDGIGGFIPSSRPTQIITLHKALFSQHPNPARSGQATYFMALASDTQATRVEIYDLSGRKIFDSGFIRGSQVSWHLHNDQGQRVANGVYLYLIYARSAGGEILQSEIRKLIVLR
jgi:subtilisin family serine protease